MNPHKRFSRFSHRCDYVQVELERRLQEEEESEPLIHLGVGPPASLARNRCSKESHHLSRTGKDQIARPSHSPLGWDFSDVEYYRHPHSRKRNAKIIDPGVGCLYLCVTSNDADPIFCSGSPEDRACLCLLEALRTARAKGGRFTHVVTGSYARFQSRKFKSLLRRLHLEHLVSPRWAPYRGGKPETLIQVPDHWRYFLHKYRRRSLHAWRHP